MHTPLLQLTAEQLRAIAASGGLPIQVEDPDTHKIYLLIEQSPDAHGEGTRRDRGRWANTLGARAN
jgi:hypothetical protein